MKQRIFVSYSREDEVSVRHLLAELRKVEVTGRLDDADISTGSAISTAIHNAIKEASAVIVLLSPASLNNSWVHFEMGAAQAMDKTIIAVILQGEGIENQLPESLSNITYLDARSESLSQIARKIEKMIS